MMLDRVRRELDRAEGSVDASMKLKYLRRAGEALVLAIDELEDYDEKVETGSLERHD